MWSKATILATTNLTLFILVQVSVTLKELGWTTLLDIPMLTLFILVQVSVTLKELGLDNPTGYPNVNLISPGTGVCDPEGAESGQPYWLSQW
jgi:hypothetical protein